MAHVLDLQMLDPPGYDGNEILITSLSISNCSTQISSLSVTLC